MRTRLFVVISTAGAAFLFAGAAPSAPPPGATALCRDGTYSFSKHRAGTCSYHGGVARWLGATNARRISVGRTVLLRSRTAASGCRLGPNPDRRCSPGAYYSKLTKRVICGASFRTSTIRNVPQSVKFAVESEYGMTPGRYGRALEIDHIVSLELGGSNDIANLFPEKLDAGPGYKVKDRLENELHDWVCAGKIGLRPAQRQIAVN